MGYSSVAYYAFLSLSSAYPLFLFPLNLFHTLLTLTTFAFSPSSSDSEDDESG